MSNFGFKNKKKKKKREEEEKDSIEVVANL